MLRELGKEKEAAAQETRIEELRGRVGGGAEPIRIEQVQSLEDAHKWFTDRDMKADLTGITNVDAMREAISGVNEVLTRYPWMTEKIGPLEEMPGRMVDLWHKEGKEWRMVGLSTYAAADVPPKIPQLGGDAFAITDTLSTYTRDVGGPVIYFNPRAFNEGRGSDLYASIGIVARPNATVRGATIHEMGHALWDVAGLRGRISQYTGSPLYGRMGEAVTESLHEAGITQRMLKKNVSWCATTNDREAFAELFLVMHSTPEEAPMSQAFRQRLGKFASAINSRFGWEVLNPK